MEEVRELSGMCYVSESDWCLLSLFKNWLYTFIVSDNVLNAYFVGLGGDELLNTVNLMVIMSAALGRITTCFVADHFLSSTFLIVLYLFIFQDG